MNLLRFVLKIHKAIRFGIIDLPIILDSRDLNFCYTLSDDKVVNYRI